MTVGTVKAVTFSEGTAAVGASAVALTNPMTTTGDTIYSSDNSGTPARLAAGLAGKKLVSGGVGVAPAWSFGSTVGKSADYVVLDADTYELINVTTGASTITITLPLAANNSGRELYIKKVDSGAGKVVADGNGSETIDGDATVQIAFQYEVIHIKCDGVNWHYVGQHYQSFNVTAPTIVNAGTSPSGFIKGVRVGRMVTITASLTTGGTGSPAQNPGMTTPVPTAFLPVVTAYAMSDTDAATETWYTADLGPSGSPTFYRWLANNSADQIGTGGTWGNSVTKAFNYSFVKY